MKLYKGTTKRIFKKQFVSKYRYELLNYGRNLKQGDLIYTCRAYNERIEEIKPCITKLSRNSWFVYDFDILTQSGGCCSLTNCCDKPKSKEYITNYWKQMDHSWFKDWEISICAKNGEDIVNENGELLREFKCGMVEE